MGKIGDLGNTGGEHPERSGLVYQPLQPIRSDMGGSIFRNSRRDILPGDTNPGGFARMQQFQPDGEREKKSESQPLQPLADSNSSTHRNELPEGPKTTTPIDSSEKLKYSGAGIMERIPPSLIRSIVPNESIKATPDFQLGKWQNPEFITYNIAGIALGRNQFTHPSEVRLVMQSGSQHRKYLVTPLSQGIIEGRVPNAPMGITVKGIFLTLQMLYERAGIKNPEKARERRIVTRLTHSPFIEGGFKASAAGTERDVTDFLSEEIPVGRVLDIVHLNMETLRPWLVEKMKQIQSPYPVLKQLQKLQDQESFALIVQAEDDVRVGDIDPEFGKRNSGPHSFPRALQRAAGAFLREIEYLGKGDMTEGEKLFSALYGVDLLTHASIVDTLRFLQTNSPTLETLNTYSVLIASEIGRMYGNIFRRFTQEKDRFNGHTIALPNPENYADWSIRGRNHDFEDKLTIKEPSMNEAIKLAEECAGLQLQQIRSILIGESSGTTQKLFAQFANEAFHYEVGK